ncbi:P protein-like [Ceratitis capitata]|uniref:P protein-like n=1 Tax=Ceratitis capitata TaxID=7213 RepID=UPI000A106C18|nr:P protein-like [Ceratitis capitata]
MDEQNNDQKPKQSTPPPPQLPEKSSSEESIEFETEQQQIPVPSEHMQRRLDMAEVVPPSGMPPTPVPSAETLRKHVLDEEGMPTGMRVTPVPSVYDFEAPPEPTADNRTPAERAATQYTVEEAASIAAAAPGANTPEQPPKPPATETPLITISPPRTNTSLKPAAVASDHLTPTSSQNLTSQASLPETGSGKKKVSIPEAHSNVDKIIEEDIHLTDVQKAALRNFESMVKHHEPDLPELQIEDIIQVKRAWLKPIGLFMVWLMFTVQFIIYRDLPSNPKLISIKPHEEKVIPVPNITDTSISLSIYGPFLQDGDLVYAGRENEASFLNIQAERIFYNSKMTAIITVKIADLWREYLDTSDKIERIVPTVRYAIMPLWQNISKDNYTRMFLRMYTNHNEIVTLKYNYDWLPVPTEKGLLFTLLVLLLLYALFIFEVTNPTLSSLICSTFALAILSILNPKPSFDTILDWIDMPMLTLLFSMMIIVAIISDAGMFDFVAIYAYQLSKGSVFRLIMNLCFFISLISGFLNNSTTMLLSSPITIKLCEVSGMNPVSVLTYVMICANVGAAFTPLGSPPNIIITTNDYLQKHGITFGTFVINMAPCTLLVLLQTYFQLRFYSTHSRLLDYRESPSVQKELLNRGIQRWRRASSALGSFLADDRRIRNVIERAIGKMRQGIQGVPKPAEEKTYNYQRTLAELKKRHGTIDKVLLIKCVAVLTFIMTIFMLRSFEYFNVIGFSWTALLGAILLLILADINDYESLLCRIEWSTLMFLSSFFVLIEVLSQLGFEDIIGHNIIKAIESTPESLQLLVALMLILWVTAFASCFLNNNPVTQMMVRVVVSIAQIKHLALPLAPLVWALVMGAAFGGNGSLIGASANIVTAGVANKHLYKLTFRKFFLVGFSIMLVNIVVASLYLILMYVVIKWDGMVF